LSSTLDIILMRFSALFLISCRLCDRKWIFDAYNISTELSRSLERKVWLKSGGYIVIDQAEALVAIDVNTGRYVGKKNLEDTILKTNLEAVQEIAYQLRLRNCGGIIILDLIDMEKEENKQRVYRVLEEAIKKDRARPTILKISELGLVEMTRKRTRDTIIRTLCEPCTHCEAKGYIKGKQTVAYEIMREIEREGTERDISKILVQAHADVIDILAIDERETLDQLERRYRKQIYLQAVTDYHPEQFEVASEKKDRAERGRDSATHAESGAGDSRSRRGGGREKTNRWGKNTQAPGAVRTVSGPPALPRPVIRDEETAEPRVLEVQVLTPPMPRDPDAIGNAVSTQIVTPNSGLVAPRPTGDDFHDEEDRLAFLRAQAAQDAAIASLVQAPGNGNQTQNNRGRPGFGGGQGFGGRDRNGGGGGKNQAGRRRKGRGGRMGGQEPREGVRSSAPRPFGPTNIVRPAQSEAPRVEAAPSSSDSNEGGGGGGERSNPPTTT
jgi:hypothetical protein